MAESDLLKECIEITLQCNVEFIFLPEKCKQGNWVSGLCKTNKRQKMMLVKRNEGLDLINIKIQSKVKIPFMYMHIS